MKKENINEFIDAYKRAKYFVLKEDNVDKKPENIDFLITVDRIIPQIDTLIESSHLNFKLDLHHRFQSLFRGVF